MLELLEQDIEKYKKPVLAKHHQKFFKTGKGEYAEGDLFLGITNPEVRSIAKKYNNLSFDDLQILLNSKYHEKRLLALIILTNIYPKKNSNKKEIFNFYLKNTKNINNWDLVDLSAYKILGDYLYNYENKNYDVLKKLSLSNNLWERRIAIISTMFFVKNNEFKASIDISQNLLKNEHDLINKAVGWIFREIGKKDEKTLIDLLKRNIKNISSTTLSYSMEKLDKNIKDEIRKMR